MDATTGEFCCVYIDKQDHEVYMVICRKVPIMLDLWFALPKSFGYLCNFGARRIILHLVISRHIVVGGICEFLGGHFSAVSLNEMSASEI